MCRSIKTLRGDASATDDDVRAAALQFVRKVSGYRQPSRRNAAAFDHAVDEIAQASRRMLEQLDQASSTAASAPADSRGAQPTKPRVSRSPSRGPRHPATR
jgi:hypothetical protein